MNIPAKIKPFFYKKKIKTGDNIIIQGKIICCSCSDFYVLYYGNEKKVFGRKKLYANDNGLILVLVCRKCDREIELFNNHINISHFHQEKKTDKSLPPLKKLICDNCACSSFNVDVTYEYPNERILDEYDNEDDFTWLWINLKCNNCRRILRRFVDIEM